jgi:uncharacterized protein
LTRPVALVTGASSGLGLELATIAARDGHDLVLVARRRDRLENIGKGLREEFGAAVTIVVRDLAESEAARVVAQEVEARGLSVELLVNNAGSGVHGPFAETPLDRELAMIRVNLVALTELTKRVLPGMIARGRGRILNVASTAAFQPGPLMAVYYATKAYVLSFSEAISSEVAGSGVTVTALCPGPTRTEFGKAAGMLETRLFRSPLVRDARSVAEAGYRGMKRGRRVVIPGIGNWILAEAVRFTPRRLVTAASLAVQKTRR